MNSKHTLEFIEHVRGLGYTPPKFQRQEDLFKIPQTSMEGKFMQMIISHIQLENIVQINQHEGPTMAKENVSKARKNIKLPTKTIEPPKVKTRQIFFPFGFKKREELLLKKSQILIKQIQQNNQNVKREVYDEKALRKLLFKEISDKLETEKSKDDLVETVSQRLQFEPEQDQFNSRIKLNELLKYDLNLLKELENEIDNYNNNRGLEIKVDKMSHFVDFNPSGLAFHFERLRCKLSEEYKVNLLLNLEEAGEENLKMSQSAVEMDYQVFASQDDSNQRKMNEELFNNLKILHDTLKNEIREEEKEIILNTITTVDSYVAEILKHEFHSEDGYLKFLTILAIPVFSQKVKISLLSMYLNEEGTRGERLNDDLQEFYHKYMSIVELENSLVLYASELCDERSEEGSCPSRDLKYEGALSKLLKARKRSGARAKTSFVQASALINKNKNKNTAINSLLNSQREEYQKQFKMVKKSQAELDSSFVQKSAQQISACIPVGQTLIDRLNNIYRRTGNLYADF